MGGSDAEAGKRQASEEALRRYIRSDTIIGIGSGSTIRYVIEELGRKIRDGSLKNVCGIPTSAASEALMREAGVCVRDIDTLDRPLDLAIDGADSVSSDFCAVKGRGGALLREKLVAMSATKFVIVCDDSKWPFEKKPSHQIPAEIVPFGHTATLRRIDATLRACASSPPCSTPNGDVTSLISLQLRAEENGSKPFVTDNGNFIVDITIARPLDRERLKRIATDLKNTVGVVEHGIFEEIPADIVVASGSGSPQVFQNIKA